MNITIKIIWSVVTVVVGSIVAGIIRDLVGVGQYIASGVIVVILFYIWGKTGSENTGIKGGSND